MKILELKSENVKRISVVEIRPDGSLVVIGGKNGAGKTSCLDSIMYALAGKRAIPTQPVKKGEEQATITVKLGENDPDLVVTRTIRPDGYTQLRVAAQDGANYPSPQAMLDKLVGALTFDPLDFARMEGGKQLETLKALLGLDFSDLDEKRQTLYDERRAVNYQAEQVKGQIAGLTQHEDAPPEEVNIADLSTELETALDSHRKAENALSALEAAESKKKAIENALSRIAGEIAELQERIGILEGEAQEREETLGRIKVEIADAQAKSDQTANAVIDPEPIRKKIAMAEETNRKVRENRALVALRQKQEAVLKKSRAFTEQITQVDKQKAQQIGKAKFPVPGLSFNAEGVLFNGLPFNQASHAERLKVSMAMGIAMNPKLKVVLIRDGSLLDEENLQVIAEMAERAKAQVWLERVGKGKEVSVIMEDGTNVPR